MDYLFPPLIRTCFPFIFQQLLLFHLHMLPLYDKSNSTNILVSHISSVQLVLKLSKTCSARLISRHCSSLPHQRSNEFLFQQLIPDYKTRWIALYYMSERILDRKVAIIEYIMYNDTREGIVLHSAQRSVLEHLFPILKMFLMTAKEVSAETASLSQVILLGHLLKKKTAEAIPDLSCSRDVTPLLVYGEIFLSKKMSSVWGKGKQKERCSSFSKLYLMAKSVLCWIKFPENMRSESE